MCLATHHARRAKKSRSLGARSPDPRRRGAGARARERSVGVEPTLRAWRARVLPLDHDRNCRNTNVPAEDRTPLPRVKTRDPDHWTTGTRKRPAGVAPASPAWGASVLLLDDGRESVPGGIRTTCKSSERSGRSPRSRRIWMEPTSAASARCEAVCRRARSERPRAKRVSPGGVEPTVTRARTWNPEPLDDGDGGERHVRESNPSHSGDNRAASPDAQRGLGAHGSRTHQADHARVSSTPVGTPEPQQKK